MRSRRLLCACLVVGCSGDDEPAGDADEGGSGESTTTMTTGATATTTDSGAATTANDDTTSETTSAVDDSTGEPAEGYDDPALWLCHPDKPEGEDYCLASDLTATEILPDGTRQTIEHTYAVDPPFDCFYVYPTVDISFQPGQTENFDDVSQELDPLLNQAARFTSMCRVFAPLYHQVTIGTFGSAQAAELLDNAYQDVFAAWTHFIEQHAGDRPFVIIGHSQGTYMTTRLVQEVVEPNETLRERMLAALLIGGSVSVPPGETVGGSFESLPLCTSADELGCIVAYRTYAADYPPAAGNQAPDIPGNDVACTNPAALAGGAGRLGGAFFPTTVNQAVVFPPIDPGDIETPFVLYRDFYASECMPDGDGLGFLAITVDPDQGDTRENPVDFGNALLAPNFLGLHVLDYNFAMQDLLDIVAAKAAAAGL